MTPPFVALAAKLKSLAREMGFSGLGIAAPDPGEAARQALSSWVASGMAGEMDYMAKTLQCRAHPQAFFPGARSVVMARLDYWPFAQNAISVLKDPEKAYISRYALGRDYHKVMRKKLLRLAKTLGEMASGSRVFADSAPVMEVALAKAAGLGFVGKHSLLIHPRRGSLYFLGGFLTTLPLPPDTAQGKTFCGSCRRCIAHCPTGAIVSPQVVDARQCISYLTIEHKTAIPENLRRPLGNRIFGCDDCQLVCPFNKFARKTQEKDFSPRHGLDAAPLAWLFSWDEKTFFEKTEGSAIRRIGYGRWLRNIAVALGNGPFSLEVKKALLSRARHPLDLVREHARWALDALGQGRKNLSLPIVSTKDRLL